MSSKFCVYTCITGGYDRLSEPAVVSPGTDYICFSDMPCAEGSAWKFLPMPEELDLMSNVKRQRVVKICPHRYLPPGYDASMWIDGNLTPMDDLLALASRYDLGSCPLYTRVHPRNKDVYQEIELCRSLGKEDPVALDALKARYESEKYPKKTGMHETNVILRRHRDAECARLCDQWAVELMKNSHRDQLSFDYVCWKNGFVAGCLRELFDMGYNGYIGFKPHAYS